MRLIENIEQLKLESGIDQQGFLNCFIALNGGARSSKQIRYDKNDKIFHVLNEIDGSFQSLSETELSSNSLIAEAIEKKALYTYPIQ